VRADDQRWRTLNLANWESRVPLHEQGYDLDRYRRDPGFLSEVVRFDLPRLGDVAGLDAVHLQCHIGTDSISLARLGAHMTGLDFSPSALAVAGRLAADCGLSVDWVHADVYDAVEALGGARFDLVYTGIGALCWLPDVARWAQVVAGLLRPGGRLFIREGHPVLWSLDDPRDDGLLVIRYPYFEVEGGTTFIDEETYVPHEEPVAAPETVGFNHGIGEILTAIADAGLRLTGFEEHRSVPWNPLGEAMEEGEDGEYRLREQPERLPLTYTLQAVRDA
jgi:SAM-dependent methyltransferase